MNSSEEVEDIEEEEQMLAPDHTVDGFIFFGIFLRKKFRLHGLNKLQMKLHTLLKIWRFHQK